MHKNFIIIFCFVLLQLSIYGKEYVSIEKKINFINLAEGVYYHNGILEEANNKNEGFIANVGLIIGDESILVIDSGPSKKIARKIINKIKSISSKPIKYLIITHRHFDHAFGIEAFKEEGTKIYISEEEFYYLKRDGPKILKNLNRFRGLKEDSINFDNILKSDIFFLNDEEVLDLGNRKVLIRNFGEAHSAGDIIVYDYNSKIYFVGDVIFRQRAAAFSDANIKNWRNKIEFFSKNFWNFIVPGHGSVIVKHADISDTAEWLKYVHNSIIKAMKNGDTTSEITQYKIPRSIENLKFINSTLQQGLKRQLENFTE